VPVAAGETGSAAVASAESFYLSGDADRRRTFLDHLRAAGLPD
jgi:hypothetical protein